MSGGSVAESVSVDGLIQGGLCGGNSSSEHPKSKEDEQGGAAASTVVGTSTIHERGEPMEEEAQDKEADEEETHESELMIVEDSSRL